MLSGADRERLLRFRFRLAEAISSAIEVLDWIDGDADLEVECEDEAAQCDDEGWLECG